MLKIGERVRTLPHTDAWMKGDRYGEVVKIGKNRLIDGRFVDPSLVRVLLDRSGDELWFHPANVEAID